MGKKDELKNLSASEKSKLKQSRLAIAAGATVACGLIILIVLMFVQRDKAKEEHEVTTLAVDQLQTDVDALDGSITDVRGELNGMLTQLDEMNEVIEQNRFTVANINGTSSVSNKNIALVEKETLLLQESLNNYVLNYDNKNNDTNVAVKNSFDKIYKDINDMSDLIKKNNGGQTNNYEDISKQLTTTLNDLDKYIKELKEQNEKEYENTSENLTTVETGIKNYIKTLKEELNLVIDGRFSDINEELNSTQTDIENTKSEITNLIKDIDKIDTDNDADLDKKIAEIKQAIKDIQGKETTTITSLEELVEDLQSEVEGFQAKNKETMSANHEATLDEMTKKYEDAIEELKAVEENIKTLDNSTTSEVNKSLKNLTDKFDTGVNDIKEQNDKESKETVDTINQYMQEITNTMEDPSTYVQD